MSRLREALGLPSKWLIREWLRSQRARPHPDPVFVFGNQKAGGSAIAGLLGAMTGLRATLDLAGATAPYFGRVMRGETPLRTFISRNAWGFSAPIVKDGHLTFIAEPLMEEFGVERAIFIHRNPLDNIRSILNRLKLPGDLDRVDVAGLRINRTWREVLSGADLNLPPDHYVTTLARRWQLASDIHARGAERYVPIRYEDFRADKIGEIRRLAQSFDLPTPNDISDQLERNFQRRGRPATDPRNFFGAENYKRITDICGESAAKLGYDLLKPSPSDAAAIQTA